MGTEEEEEEEYLVHVEFESILESDTFKDQNMFFKVIGIDSEKPIMQIGDQVFTGQYRDIPGTSLFFEENDVESADDTVFAKTAEKTLQYKYKTRKSLVMRRVFIKKKDLSSVNGAQEEIMSDEDEIDMIEKMALSQHDMVSESLLGSELGMEIAGVKLKEEMCFPVKSSQSTRGKQSKGNKGKGIKAESRNLRDEIEPVAGPSWAPDVPPVDCDEMFDELPTSSVNADEMSRLIEEQMTLESDIKMQNSTLSAPDTD